MQAALEKAAAAPPTVPAPMRPGAPPAAQAGVYALTNASAIMVVDARTFLTYGPFLEGQLGSTGGGLFDVVRTKTGGKAIVSNFGDSQIHFIDMRVPGAPAYLGATDIPFFAEDMAISPNQKYVLVTDGGFSPRVVTVNAATRALVDNYDMTSFSVYANAVAIAKDNQTVLVADYFTPAVGVLTMNPMTGFLNFVESRNTGTMRPVNVAISPNGLTGVLVGCSVDGNPDPGDPVVAMGAALRITGPGAMIYGAEIPAPDPTISASQSAVFSRDGSKLYWLASKEEADPATGDYEHVVYVFNVPTPGTLVYSGIEIPLLERGGGSCLFGVDAMSIDPKNEFLYVSNPTISGGKNRIAVIDLATNRHVASLVGAPLPTDWIPTGIAFK
jgi:DNA-binding beta-propeller fold protein YncE